MLSAYAQSYALDSKGRFIRDYDAWSSLWFTGFIGSCVSHCANDLHFAGTGAVEQSRIHTDEKPIRTPIVQIAVSKAPVATPDRALSTLFPVWLSRMSFFVSKILDLLQTSMCAKLNFFLLLPCSRQQLPHFCCFGFHTPRLHCRRPCPSVMKASQVIA